MSSSIHMDFTEAESEQIRRVATSLEQTPEDIALEAHTYGMYMLQRYAALRKRAEKADVAKAIEILRRAGKNNPPDPGDELPEDLRYLLAEYD
jgi:hypothetical protein